MGTGRKIRHWRERRSYSQGELAQMIGITQNSLWRIEDGRSQPRPATLRKIAEALKVPVEDLMASPDEAKAAGVG